MKKLVFARTHNLGLTLMELLIVISIIGVLSAILLSSIGDSRQRSRDGFRISQIREVKNALALYYSEKGYYPYHTVAPPWLTPSGYAPSQWHNMLNTLMSVGLIHPTFDLSQPDYYGSSIQDPLYKSAEDYKYSFAYMAYNNQQGYKIRIYLENSGNILFKNSLEGSFFDESTTGLEACDKDFHYYCTGNEL